MKKLIYLSVLLLSQFGFSQAQAKSETSKTDSSSATYDRGINGIEFIIPSETGTVVVSTFNAKPMIKNNIAQKVYMYFKNNTSLASGDTIKIVGADADVTGKLFVEKKGKLTSLNFHYEKIDWKSGLVEVYKR